MLRALALTAIVLLVFIFAVEPAMGEFVRSEFVIPLDRYVNLSSNLTIHTLQITISNETYGGAYSKDPANSTWAVLSFQYENYGSQQVAGRLQVQFVDNESAVYEKSDVFLGGPIYPGKKTIPQPLEIAIPKDRVLTQLIVIDEWDKTKVLIPIVYPTASSSGFGSTPAPAALVFDDNLRNLLIIPIILVVVGFVGWFIAKRRLF